MNNYEVNCHILNDLNLNQFRLLEPDSSRLILFY